MNDFDIYIAKTQARLAFFLIIILVMLSAMVMALLIFPQIKPEQAIIGLIVQVVTGVLALCGSAIAYFFARHRPPTVGDNDDPVPPKAQSPLVPSNQEKKP
jgi:hypothetical protein